MNEPSAPSRWSRARPISASGAWGWHSGVAAVPWEVTAPRAAGDTGLAGAAGREGAPCTCTQDSSGARAADAGGPGTGRPLGARKVGLSVGMASLRAGAAATVPEALLSEREDCGGRHGAAA